MEPTSDREVHKALAMRLARREIDDKALARAAARITKNGLKIGGVDLCPYGICIDYFVDRQVSIDEFLADGIFRAVKIFPYGIIDDDFWWIRAEMHVPEIADFQVRG